MRHIALAKEKRLFDAEVQRILETGGERVYHVAIRRAVPSQDKGSVPSTVQIGFGRK